ncbi:hypothetical protein [Deinococcus navajonensis]|uniref:Uncharacterized protein n=1 Tax=Deinococcus navajonensis TaxID=309884 RepID=A0ABV8XIU0_9DEIO
MTDRTERPSRPIPAKPAGYVELARYSSLGRLWSMLAGAQRAGRKVSLVRGDLPETARRRVSGYALPGAGIFVDVARLTEDLSDGFQPHPALVALLSGDGGPLRAELNSHFELRLDFVVALTAARDLVARPEFRFTPIVPGLSTLPADLNLRARRLPRDEVHLLIQRACGLA